MAVYKVMLKIQTGSKIRTNGVDFFASDLATLEAAVVTYADIIRDCLKTSQEIINGRAYEYLYDIAQEKWVSGDPVADIPLSATGNTGVSPGDDLPLGMKILINQRDASPLRDGRIMLTVPYTEGEVSPNGEYFKLTDGNTIATNTSDAMLNLNSQWTSSDPAYPVNLHRKIDTPQFIVEHYVRYIDKYRKRL